MSDTIILKGIVGSTAYGLAKADSDVDYLGCYVTPTVAFMGLTSPRETHVEAKPLPDYTRHEVGKYVRLLLKSNPTMTELLWLPKELLIVDSPFGQELRDLRKCFNYAKGVRSAYVGYVKTQFEKLDKRKGESFASDLKNRPEKHARHLKRLLEQGFQLYSTGHLQVHVENDPEEYHEFGKAAIKDLSIAKKLIHDYEIAFDTAKSVLPSAPNTRAIEDWLISIRRRFYNEQA